MASEQKLQSTDDNQSRATAATSGDLLNPSNDSQPPSGCAFSLDHEGEPVTHPATAPREEHVEERTADEGHGVVIGVNEGHGVVIGVNEGHGVVLGVNEGHGVDIGVNEGHGGERAGKEERKKEEEEKTTEEKVTCDGASQVEVAENTKDVPVGLLVSLDDNGPSKEDRTDQDPQVTGEMTGPQVTGEGARPQVLISEMEMQGIDNETGLQVARDRAETRVIGEETDAQKRDELGGNVEAEEDRGVGMTDTGVHGNPDAQVSPADESWIEMLVHNIVKAAASEGAYTGKQDTSAQVSVEAPDTTLGMMEGEHSTMQESGKETMTPEQVTLHGAGAAAQVDTDGQISNDNTDIALHVSREEPGVQARAEQVIPEQVHEKATGIYKQVGEAAAHREDSAGAQVTVSGEEVQKDISRNLEAGGQFIASGEEAHREVTPDLDTLPGREGTVDQDQPVACREKEWPSLICTVSEVRTVTGEQGDAQKGLATWEGPSDWTPEMKEREIVEDGHSPTNETPIEREIRLAMEREMTLRQERGISSPIGQPELVEVRRKTISVEPMAIPGKERQLAGAQMQREIQLETRREQDLVDLGKVMGTYDRGPQQELQEKKMIFESMNTEPSDPPIGKKQSESQQQQKSQEAPPTYVSLSTNHVVPVKEAKKGPSYAEANGSNVIIIEHGSVLRRSAPRNTFSSAPADSWRSAPADSWRSAPADSWHSTPADSWRSAPADSWHSTPADSWRSAPADSWRSAPADSWRSAPADSSRSNRRSFPAEISQTDSPGFPLPRSADSPPASPYQALRSPSPRSLLEREIEEVKERERELQRQRSSVYGMDDSVEETLNPQEITSDFQSVYEPERPNWGKLEVNWPPNKEAAINGQQQVLDSPRSRRQLNALFQSWESGTPNPKDDE